MGMELAKWYYHADFRYIDLNKLASIGLFIIGLFVGIDLLFVGFAYIMSAMAAKRLSR